MRRRLTAYSRKQQIVEEATRLFSRDGYDRVTTKDLSASCGISEPALYRYFASKEAIYAAVLDSLALRLNCDALFEKLSLEEDVEGLLRELAAHIIAYFHKNEDIYRLVLYSTLGGHAKAKQVYQAIRGTYVEFLLRQLDRLFAAGMIIPRNNEITARCFVGMVFECTLGGTLFRGFLGKKYRPAEVVANNIPIFARGLRRES